MKKQAKTNIRISGGESHNHRYELVFYDGCHPSHKHPYPHRHHYEGITSFDVGHQHRLFGATAPAPNVEEHVHAYEGTTTFNDGHVHHFKGVTSEPIPLPGGGHYHTIEGETTVNGRIPHEHSYSGIAR